MKIVTNMDFTDPDDTGVDAVYIQISTGYVFGEDKLILTGSHPTISNIWNINTGKMTLIGTSGQPTYTELKAAIEDIEYISSSTHPSGTKTFSISIGQANYLPSNGHYYEYIPNLGVTWTDARNAAQTNTYYGLQGYLATITAADEAQLAGEQASGAGWIGGSDEQQEGTWKWMTGPEAGTIMSFTFWNNGEPNNLGDEDYAHVTAPGVGITGSWNDLSNTGSPSGDYQPKGFIVEYGGMPGDPIIKISTSTTITIPAITSTIAASKCDSGALTLQATTNFGTINWYPTAIGGTTIGTGTSFTTSLLSNTTTYYVDSFPSGCNAIRTPVVATINYTPTISITPPNPVCENNTATILASNSVGIINWFTSATATIPIAVGPSFTTPVLNQSTTYYAEANNNGCLSNRLATTINVFPLPNVVNENKILCEQSNLVLDAGISNVSYLWSTQETTKFITISTPGNYSVTVTTQGNPSCSNTKTINVVQHDIPLIDNIIIENSTAQIIVNSSGSFEYSIDGVNYQNSNLFTIDEGGKYIAYVREKYGCGINFRSFVIISIPEFFTPNNDGNNDYWTIKGLTFYPKASVKIFDRYGKMITQLNALKSFWDGTLDGKNLFADDYWYVFKIDEDSPEVKGHFSLKR